MSLGGTIYRLRTEKNMSQGDLADALDVSRQSVSKWENDSSIPDLDKLKKLSQLFDISLDELVNGEPRPEPKAQTVIYAAPEKQPMPGHMIAGIILLICAAVVFVTFTIIGFFEGSMLLGLLAAIPLVLNGTVCMLCKKNTGFFCCWINYTLVWLFITMISIRTMGSDGMVPARIFYLFMLTLLAAMVAWSLYKLYKGHFSAGRVAKVIWTVVLVLLLGLQLHITITAITTVWSETVYEEDTDIQIDITDASVTPDEMV